MTTLIENKLGIILKELRVEKGYSLRELGNRTGISFSYIGKFEQGKFTPSKEDLEKIIAALEADTQRNYLMLLAGYVPDEVTIPKINLNYDIGSFTSRINHIIDSFKESAVTSEFLKDDLISPVHDEYLENIFSFYINIFSDEDLSASTKYIRYLGLDEELKDKLYNILLKKDYSQVEYSEKIELLEMLNTMHARSKESVFSFERKYFSNRSDFLIKSPQETYFCESKKVTSASSILDKAKSKMDNLLKTINKTSNNAIPLLANNSDAEFVSIPIYGEIKAGYDMLGEQNIIDYQITDRRSVSDGEYFYLVVKGDSMIDAGIRDGCKVLVKKGSVTEGKIGVVIVNGEEATLKRVFYEGDNIILQAENKELYPKPRIYPLKDVLIQGQVKSFVVDL